MLLPPPGTEIQAHDEVDLETEPSASSQEHVHVQHPVNSLGRYVVVSRSSALGDSESELDSAGLSVLGITGPMQSFTTSRTAASGRDFDAKVVRVTGLDPEMVARVNKEEKEPQLQKHKEPQSQSKDTVHSGDPVPQQQHQTEREHQA